METIRKQKSTACKKSQITSKNLVAFKNVLCGFLLAVICFYFGGIYYFNNIKTDILNEQISLENDNELLSIYIQNSDGTYTPSTSTKFPEDGYTLNEEKSYCINGSNISYNLKNNQVSISTNGSENCYLFFDGITFPQQILLDNTVITSTPDFSTTEGTGLYVTEDEYGDTYYFRGEIDNNWVYFAGYYWRIIRIDGNGNVKMIYSGETAPTEDEAIVMTGEGTQIATTVYQSEDIILNDGVALYNSSEGVGYVYTDGLLHGSANDSYIKTVVDDWYEENIVDLGYSSYVQSTVYCADRKAYSDKGVTSMNIDGYTLTHYFNAYAKLTTNKSPSLECTYATDEILLEVGLISADEASYAGLVSSNSTGIINTQNYLNTNEIYWTLSPSLFYQTSGSVYTVSRGYFVNYSTIKVFAARPTLSIKSTISTISLLQGTGTWNDPYVITE